VKIDDKQRSPRLSQKALYVVEIRNLYHSGIREAASAYPREEKKRKVGRKKKRKGENKPRRKGLKSI